MILKKICEITVFSAERTRQTCYPTLMKLSKLALAGFNSVKGYQIKDNLMRNNSSGSNKEKFSPIILILITGLLFSGIVDNDNRLVYFKIIDLLIVFFKT